MRLFYKFVGGLQLARDYVSSAVRLREYRGQFDHVRFFCLFVGYPRSGHTLVGSLLDAHRYAIIGLELDALKYVRYGFSREQIFVLLAENSRLQAGRGRQWTGYSYYVPNQWQGRAEQIRVIGDKRGGGSSRRLARDPGLLDRLRQRIGVPLKLIHVVRNPYDNIATMALRKDAASLEDAIRLYFKMTDTVARVRRNCAPGEFITVHHEHLIARPADTLQALCDFLELPADGQYLQDCSSIVFESPHHSRNKVAWAEEQLEDVARHCARYDFLADYAAACP